MIALQLLFRREANPDEPAKDDDDFIRSELMAGPDDFPVNDGEDGGENAPLLTEKERESLAAFVKSLLAAVEEHRAEIDSELTGAAENWRIERMSATDRNILRLAIAEIRWLKTPEAVVINEAINLAKKFGTADSGAFINGVLGRVVK